MKKPKYHKRDIWALFTDLEGVDDGTPEIQTVRSSITQIRLKNLHSEGYIKGDPLAFVRQQIQSLTEQLQLLQKVADTFDTTPMKEMPTLINDSNEIVAVIARWRLKLGQ